MRPGRSSGSALGSQCSSSFCRSANIGGAGRPQDGEHWLLDAVRVVFGERPLLDGGYFLGEERVGVGDCLLEGPGQPVVERGTVAGSEDAAEEDVDRSGLVARAVALDSGQDDVRAELPLGVGGRGGPRGLHEGEGVHGLGGVQRELECYRDAGGVADDVGPGDAELAHQLMAVGGVRGHGGRAF